MNIEEAKRHVRDTVEAYLATDEAGLPMIEASEQRPLFLVGAPGIGKTAIVGQVARELGIGLVSYSMTHHTRQSALGLPFIVHREFDGVSYEASEYTMSEIVASIYDYMRESGVREGILFLDEINCVSETLYPSMLQFLQFKTFGRHRVPQGWIVVCAGNPPEYNKSVHDFDIVTLDRLRKIELAPDFACWRRYAGDIGVHPAILTFLDAKKECFYAVESTPSGKSFITARGWVDLSKMITLFEAKGKPVDRSLIEQFVQKEDVAEQFSSYYQLFAKYRADYQIGDILAGTASDDIAARATAAPFDERLALVGLLLDALAGAMGATLDEEAALTTVRDELRALKEALLSGAAMQETLGARIEQLTSAFARDSAAARLAPAQTRERTQTLSLLKELKLECELTGKLAGKDAFDAIHYTYRGFVGALEQSIKAATDKLDNAFAFIERAFPDEREMLVFVTELTARTTSAQFINKFGSERYYQSNDRLLYAKHADSLKQRISALDEEDESAEAAQALSAPVTDDEKLAAYYASAQFEYGFASLCNMTLPNDLRGKHVLNLGCRRGKGVFKMSERVGDSGRVVGIDWVGDYIAEARERMERAWRKSGLAHNNMAFHVAYPEELAAAGIEDATFDLVFVNSVVNLAYSPERVYAEAFRALKPGGVFVCETVLADTPRSESVVSAARALGNSIQAAPYKKDFEAAMARIGFEAPRYVAPYEISPNTGYKFTYEVETAPSDEHVIFTAQVAELRKPQ